METKKVSKKNRPDAASATAKQFSSTVVNRRAVEWTGWTFLKDKAFDLTSVNVKTTDGSVDLSGTVPSLDARERAVKLAWQVRGLWRRAAQVHGFLFRCSIITKNPMVQGQAGWQRRPEFPFGIEGIE
jgi:BON domain